MIKKTDISVGIPEDEQNILARFENVYSNLPLEERKRPIVFLDNQPVSWELAYKEIKNNTKIGREIANKLINLKVI